MLETPTARWGSLKFLRQLYYILNRDFFDGELPHIKIVWAELPSTILARCKWRRYQTVRRTKGKAVVKSEWKPVVMQFRKELKPQMFQKQVGMSMVHEMAHLRLGPEVACTEWDGKFDKLMMKLTRKGAFRRFW